MRHCLLWLSSSHGQSRLTPRQSIPWARALGIDARRVTQQIRPLDPANTPLPGAPSSMRCLIAEERIARGEPVFIVPRSAALDAAASISVIAAVAAEQQKGNSTGSSQSSLPTFFSALRGAGATLPEVEKVRIPLGHRDALLQIFALAAMRSSPCGASSSTDVDAGGHRRAWQQWIAAMPKQAPPLGPATEFAASSQRDMKSLRFARSSPSAGDPNTAKQLTLHDIASVQSVLDDTLATLNRALLTDVTQSSSHPAPASGWLRADVLSWASFMYRSRAIAVSAAASVPTLLPMVDMINHSLIGANVTVVHPTAPVSGFDGGATCSADVLVTAIRTIEAGEQILINYGDANQRARFLPSKVDVLSSAEVNKMSVSRTRVNNALATRLAKATEEEQRRARGIVGDPVAWAWQFGFPISEAERDWAAETLWGHDLQRRVMNMTERRRRGQVGEFVAGVPPALPHMKAAREALQRERYGGRDVFPRQAA